MLRFKSRTLICPLRRFIYYKTRYKMIFSEDVITK